MLGESGAGDDGVPVANTIVDGFGPSLTQGVATAMAAHCGSRRVERRARAGLPRSMPAAASAKRSSTTSTAGRASAALLDRCQRQHLRRRVVAVAATEAGAQIIAVIRSTGQSLLDFVPEGATTEGFGGTYATQENFRIMREALDEAGERLGRYVMLTNYGAVLCMPEIAALAALDRLDMLLNDSMYGILFRDINMRRTFVDQHFSRMLNAHAGIIINTGEDNYLTTADAVEQAPSVLASQFINEEFAHRAGLPDKQLGLGDAFEIDPDLEDGFLFQLAQAQLTRQIFPDAPLKYMPPTKHMTGDIFKGHLMDGMFDLTSVMTHQTIHLCGMLTEAIHTPLLLGDRALSIEGAR